MLRALAAPGMLGQTGRKLRQRLRSDAPAFGFKRDLEAPFEAPKAKIPITVRRIEPGDAVHALDIADRSLAPEERWERASRRRLLDSGLGCCFVAVGDDGRVCYMQWLFGAAENDAIARYFHGTFPRLAADEALLEGAYTPSAFRGQGIMPAAMAQIAGRGLELGARQVVTFVGADNIASMKGCLRSGFFPYIARSDSWRGLRRQIGFSPLPPGFATDYAAIFR